MVLPWSFNLVPSLVSERKVGQSPAAGLLWKGKRKGKAMRGNRLNDHGKVKKLEKPKKTRFDNNFT